MRGEEVVCGEGEGVVVDVEVQAAEDGADGGIEGGAGGDGGEC